MKSIVVIKQQETRKQYFSLIIFLAAIAFSSFGQIDSLKYNALVKKQNSFDVSIGGLGLFASLNFSRYVLIKENYFVNTSIGIGTVPMVGGMVLPHQITFNYGKNRKFLEVGLGGTYWGSKIHDEPNKEEVVHSYNLAPIIGWRIHFKNNMVFRVYATPIFHVAGAYILNDYSVLPYGGFSLGINL
jgi:hypothetical protein